MAAFEHLLLHILGIDDVSGRWYAFWSGFGGDLPLFGGIFLFIRHRTCHVHHCWRPGLRRHGEHLLCGKHHPDGPLLHHHLLGGDR